jgi:hypothetical protein
MKLRSMATLSVLALAAAIAPIPTLAADAGTVSYNLTTRQYDPIEAGEYDGTLRIRVTADGIVSGTYMNSEARVSTVTGGLSGKNIWLQLNGRPFGLTYNGTFVDGKLSASTFGHGLQVWNLEGTPAKH